jgi:hypothetical protein
MAVLPRIDLEDQAAVLKDQGILYCYALLAFFQKQKDFSKKD